jgi:hypothetical protein
MEGQLRWVIRRGGEIATAAPQGEGRHEPLDPDPKVSILWSEPDLPQGPLGELDSRARDPVGLLR